MTEGAQLADRLAALERSVNERFDQSSAQLSEITDLLRQIESRPGTANSADGEGEKPKQVSVNWRNALESAMQKSKTDNSTSYKKKACPPPCRPRRSRVPLRP